MSQLKPNKLRLLCYSIQILLTILFYHVSSSFFLIIDLCFLIPAVITQICNPIVELVIPIGISSKEAKAKMEMHPVTVEIDISKCPI